MKIEIWSDIACPWCWVGKRRFERALNGFSHRDEVEIVWRSFELDPAAPARHDEPAPVLLARKYGMPVAQAEAMNAQLAGQAKKEGLEMRLGTLVVGNTFDAHRLIHFAAAAGQREAMVERLFRAYFTDNEAVGDREVLARLAGEVGLDADAARAMLAGDAYAKEVRADEQRARAFGISGVPFFAIDERYGISGAQPPELILDALRQAWGEANAGATGETPVPAGPADDACADGSCAV